MTTLKLHSIIKVHHNYLKEVDEMTEEELINAILPLAVMSVTVNTRSSSFPVNPRKVLEHGVQIITGTDVSDNILTDVCYEIYSRMDSQFQNMYNTELISETHDNVLCDWSEIARAILKAKYKLEHL